MLVKTRLILLLLGSVAAVAVVGVAATAADHAAIQRMVAIEQRDHGRLLQSVVERHAEARQTWTFDNSFWDDAVTFVADGGTDVAWADENFGAALEQIGADAVLVYGADARRLYATTTAGSEAVPARIDGAALVAGSAVKHFFIAGAGDVLEVHAATIVPSADRPHATPARGAIALVKVWNAETVTALAASMDATMVLAPPDAPPHLSTMHEVAAELPLNGPDGKPTARLQSTEASMLAALAAQRESATRATLAVMLALALGLGFAAQRWVLVPILRLSESLAQRRPGPLQGLETTPDEFGALSRLMVQHFAQSEAMEAEIAVRIAAEAAVTRSLHEKEVLLREIHHRVKNNLQIISSLLTLQSQQMPSPEAQGLLEECVHRVRSMALIHQQLYGVESLERIDLGVYAQALSASLRGSLAPQCRVHVDADPVEVAVDTAVPIALILNELLTNAFKYGTPPAHPAEDWDVCVRVTGTSERFTLTVRDHGPGLPENFDLNGSNTLGLQLIRALCRQIHARLSATTESGACFTFVCTPRAD